MTLRRVGDNQAIMVMYHVPGRRASGCGGARRVGGVLGDSPSGRLYKALVDNKKAVGAGMDLTSCTTPAS